MHNTNWIFSFLISTLVVLPTFAQEQTIGMLLNRGTAQEGYTLFSPNRTTYLVDNCGRYINSWESNYQPGLSAYLTHEGKLVRPGSIGSTFRGNGVGGRLEQYNWEGELEWVYDYASTTYHQHHDIEPMPNGNILVIAWELKSASEAVLAGRDSNLLDTLGIWLEHIVEIQPMGTDDAKIVWEWHVWDHLVQDIYSTRPNYGTIAEHPDRINFNYVGVKGRNYGLSTALDWMHFNAIDYNPDRDEIAVSSRVFNEIFIIDHSTTTEEARTDKGGKSGKGGRILYRWGNPQAYDRGTTEDRQFFLQHDIRWIPAGFPDEGKLMVFNNGDGLESGRTYSSVDLFEPPLDNDGNYVLAEGQPFGPSALSWTYTEDPPERMFAPIMSGAHRLPNGNTLVCEADNGRFFEVDTLGTKVWEYVNPVSLSGPLSQGGRAGFQNIFRATKYPIDHPAFSDKKLVPGEVLELNSLPSDCTTSLDQVTSIRKAPSQGIRMIENPVRDQLRLENTTGIPVSIKVHNISGKSIWQSNSPVVDRQTVIPSAQWPAGLYLLTVIGQQNNFYYTTRFVKQ